MKLAIIKQFIRLEKMLRLNSYEVIPTINQVRNELIIVIPLKGGNDKEIMAQWNDLRRVEG